MIRAPAMTVYPSENFEEQYGASAGEIYPAHQIVVQSIPAGANNLENMLSRLSQLAQQAQNVEQFLQTQLQQQVQVSPQDRQACDNVIHSILNEIILIGSSILSNNPPAQQKNIEIPAEQNVKTVTDEVIEMDEDDILAEHSHFCQICGKGFRRDANVRMHMRAHGNQYKTAEALMSRVPKDSARESKYSCPINKCRRNRFHPKFRPLKSVVSLRNHYKRNHCPKMYSCNKCGKEFSVVADLKTHGKNCGHNRWRCSCGTTFIRKDKLFGHVALFEGHKPLLPENPTAMADRGKPKAEDCNDLGKEVAGRVGSNHLGQEILKDDEDEEMIMLGSGSNNAQFKFQIGHESQIGLLYEDDIEESDDSRKMYESVFWPELSADMFDDAS